MTSTASRLPHGARRRAKIVDAAIGVIAEHGVEAMSHRRVAAAAGVPLAATTYYFTSLDELRTAALRETVRRDLAPMEEQLANLGQASDLAELLGQLIHDWLEDRVTSVVTIEIFASAMRRESVREIARSWEAAWLGALEPRVGRVRALTSVAAAFGYVQHALLEEDHSLEEATAVMRQALGGPS